MKTALTGKVWKYGDDVDTDVIIPARYLSTSVPEELAPHCMEDIDETFAKNVQKGDILLARDNFGCGSSREHAPWAIENYGFRVIIAPSFADIFFNNTFKNGLLPIVASSEVVDRLFDEERAASEGYSLDVDLEAQTVTSPTGFSFTFDITPHRKHCLLNGLDEIGLTLRHADEIHAFEVRHKAAQPWLFAG